MLKKAICTLLLSGMPFVANMALAVEGQFSEFSDSSLVSDNTAPIDINTATAEQLMTLKGIGKKKAQAIIQYRDTHHGFRSIEELDNVKGIGSKLLGANLARITIHTVTTSQNIRIEQSQLSKESPNISEYPYSSYEKCSGNGR